MALFQLDGSRYFEEKNYAIPLNVKQPFFSPSCEGNKTVCCSLELFGSENLQRW